MQHNPAAYEINRRLAYGKHKLGYQYQNNKIEIIG
jgi:hypothetical protein